MTLRPIPGFGPYRSGLAFGYLTGRVCATHVIVDVGEPVPLSVKSVWSEERQAFEVVSATFDTGAALCGRRSQEWTAAVEFGGDKDDVTCRVCRTKLLREPGLPAALATAEVKR